MRVVKFLEELATNLNGQNTRHNRCDMSVYEHACGNHYCRRQWPAHNALYSKRSRGDAETSTSPNQPRLSLTIDQLTQKLLLENPRCRGWVLTSDARAWVRNKLMQRGVTDVAGAVLKAVRGMAEAGVLKMDTGTSRDSAIRDGPGDSRRVRRRGKAVHIFEKMKAAEIQRSGDARALLVALGVSGDHFHD